VFTWHCVFGGKWLYIHIFVQNMLMVLSISISLLYIFYISFNRSRYLKNNKTVHIPGTILSSEFNYFFVFTMSSFNTYHVLKYIHIHTFGGINNFVHCKTCYIYNLYWSFTDREPWKDFVFPSVCITSYILYTPTTFRYVQQLLSVC
jgi:hypothetical protein